MRFAQQRIGSASSGRRLLIIAATICAAVIAPAGAAAHSSLTASNPANGATVTSRPSQATLTFNEPIIAKGSAFTLIDRTKQAPRPLTAKYRGAKVTLTLPAQIATGPVTINYRIVSADGHPVTGKVAFTYQDAGAGAGAGGGAGGGAGAGGGGDASY